MFVLTFMAMVAILELSAGRRYSAWYCKLVKPGVKIEGADLVASVPIFFILIFFLFFYIKWAIFGPYYVLAWGMLAVGTLLNFIVAPVQKRNVEEAYAADVVGNLSFLGFVIYTALTL